MKHSITACLAVSHKDAQRALLWLRWGVFLSQQEGGDLSDESLVVFMTQFVEEETIAEMKDACDVPTFFKTKFLVCHDTMEVGYPASASHLFVRSLKATQKLYPKRAVLFMEPDTCQMCPTWFHDIKAEYATHEQPFMGREVASTRQAIEDCGFGERHLTGNCVYPPNAFKLAPSLKSVLDMDVAMSPWKGMIAAWDLFAGHELVPQNEEPETIQQIWEPKPFTVATLGQIDPKTRLFHRDKSGGLIQALAQKHYPGFMDTLPKVGRFFMLDAYAHDIEVDGHVFSFVRCAKSVGGRYVHAKQPATTVEAERLTALSGRHGITEISEKDYESLLEQRRRNRLA